MLSAILIFIFALGIVAAAGLASAKAISIRSGKLGAGRSVPGGSVTGRSTRPGWRRGGAGPTRKAREKARREESRGSRNRARLAAERASSAGGEEPSNSPPLQARGGLLGLLGLGTPSPQPSPAVAPIFKYGDFLALWRQGSAGRTLRGKASRGGDPGSEVGSSRIDQGEEVPRGATAPATRPPLAPCHTPTGILNWGATCYAASTVQALLTPVVVRAWLADRGPSGARAACGACGRCVICAVAELGGADADAEPEDRAGEGDERAGGVDDGDGVRSSAPLHGRRPAHRRLRRLLAPVSRAWSGASAAGWARSRLLDPGSRGAAAGGGGDGRRRPLDAHSLLRRLAERAKRAGHGPSFSLGRQEDAHELWVCLLDALEGRPAGDLSPPGPPPGDAGEATSFIRSAFGLALVNTIACERCGRRSSTTENTDCLTLDVADRDIATLYDALFRMAAAEALDGYRCDGCNAAGSCWRSTMVAEPPNLLALCLKRFGSAGVFGKITRDVAFPRLLELGPFLDEGRAAGAGEVPLAQPRPPPPLPRSLRYRLTAVVEHQDYARSAAFGHYIAYVRPDASAERDERGTGAEPSEAAGPGGPGAEPGGADPSAIAPPEPAWYVCDDEHVARCEPPRAPYVQPYLLLYERVGSARGEEGERAPAPFAHDAAPAAPPAPGPTAPRETLDAAAGWDGGPRLARRPPSAVDMASAGATRAQSPPSDSPGAGGEPIVSGAAHFPAPDAGPAAFTTAIPGVDFPPALAAPDSSQAGPAHPPPTALPATSALGGPQTRTPPPSPPSHAIPNVVPASPPAAGRSPVPPDSPPGPFAEISTAGSSPPLPSDDGWTVVKRERRKRRPGMDSTPPPTTPAPGGGKKKRKGIRPKPVEPTFGGRAGT